MSTRYIDKLTELKKALRLSPRPSPMSLYNIGKNQAIEIWKNDPEIRESVIDKLDDMFIKDGGKKFKKGPKSKHKKSKKHKAESEKIK